MAQPAGMSWAQYAASMGHAGAPNPAGWQPVGNPSPPAGFGAAAAPAAAYGLRANPQPSSAYPSSTWGRRRGRRANRKTRRNNRKNRRNNTMRRRR